MKSKLTPIPAGVIYPGNYVPGCSEQDLRKEMSRARIMSNGLPPVNVRNLPDHIHVEMAIPGVRREDFFVHADDHILFIIVMHKEPIYIEEKEFCLHEFNYTYIDRQVLLPDDADVSFISAEYQNGMLSIIIPKSMKPVRQLHADIVVY